MIEVRFHLQLPLRDRIRLLATLCDALESIFCGYILPSCHTLWFTKMETTESFIQREYIHCSMTYEEIMTREETGDCGGNRKYDINNWSWFLSWKHISQNWGRKLRVCSKLRWQGLCNQGLGGILAPSLQANLVLHQIT